MRKRIGIVSLVYGWLPCEPGPSRFYYIAKTFCNAGWDVDFIGGSFQHFEKKPRDKAKIMAEQYPFKITMIDTPSYKKNISFRRLNSYRVSKTRLLKYLDKQEYDIIYCSIPANDVAATVAEYCNKKNIPFIVDVEDLWPEGMAIAIHNKFLQNIIFPYFHKDAERTYALASAAVGTSEDFTERAVKYNHRSIPLKTVYVGCDVDVFDKGVKNHSVEINKEPSEFWVTYAGSISNSYDIATLVLAGKELLKSGRSDIKIKILGTGTLKEQCESLAKEYNCNNVEFLGYVAYPKMAAYLSKSDIVINSFVKGAPQSIVNKIGDYLSSGKPMINTLENPVFTQIVESNHVGINIEPGNPSLLAKTIEELIDDSNKREVLGKNARKLAKTRFDRKESYKEIVNLAESLLN